VRRFLLLVALLVVGAVVGVPSGGSAPDNRDPLATALNYIRENRERLGLTAADVTEMAVTDRYRDAHNGVTHIYFQQRFRGIGVYNGVLNVSVDRDGGIVTVGARFVPNLAGAVNTDAPGRAAQQAVRDAARAVGLQLRRDPSVLRSPGGPAREVVFDDAGISLRPIPANLVYQPLPSGAARLAWNVQIYDRSTEHYWSVNVDALTGDPLLRDDWVDDASYNVFAMPKESPSDGDRTIEENPADPVASPLAWHDTGLPGGASTLTRGNNADAYVDADADDLPDPGSHADGGGALIFDFPLDLTRQPSTYQDAAVTNLFYWNNLLHDVSYRYGFTEAAGNFQDNNFVNGGVGLDAVHAEAQDGSGINNANFLTLPDGTPGRMQMFVWRPGVQVRVNSPASIAGEYEAGSAGFGPQLTSAGVTGDVELAHDNEGVSDTDGCEPIDGFTAGRIALVDRGNCNFTVKVKNAQDAGAIAAIVANNVDGPPPGMSGTDSTITIPSVSITQADGQLFKDNLPINATPRALTEINRDSDLDSGVIAHEYTHGISNRLTGGPSNTSCLNTTLDPEQMGEGWSDWFALFLTAKASHTAATSRGIGTYVVFQPPDGVGIRPTPYTTDMSVNPSTYDTIKNTATITAPHGVGYVWATMLWEVYWNLVEEYGFNPDFYGDWTTGGNNLAMQLVMDGMKLQPCLPGFVDGRDAILAADGELTGGDNQCLIWAGFAKRGLGYSASQGSSTSRTDGKQAFDMPPACAADIAVTPASLSSNLVHGSQETQTLTIENRAAGGATALNWTITEAASSCSSPSDLPWVSAAPASGTTPGGATSSVNVTFDSNAVPPGVHSGVLCVSSNDADTPTVSVPLTLDVDYAFSGFFGSVSNPPTVNQVNAGATVSIKFSLSGDWGLNIFATGFPRSQQIDCATKAVTGSAASTRTGRGQSLTYDAANDRYNYPWATDRKWAGTCRVFQLGLNDGTNHIAYFRFTS
jgi:extracellular elastinolytic metalloproteinase